MHTKAKTGRVRERERWIIVRGRETEREAVKGKEVWENVCVCGSGALRIRLNKKWHVVCVYLCVMCDN